MDILTPFLIVWNFIIFDISEIFNELFNDIQISIIVK